MLHGHFDEAFFLGQKYIEGSRVGIKGLWGPTHCDYNSVTATLFAQRKGSALFV